MTINARLIVVTAAITLLAGCETTGPLAPVSAPAQSFQVEHVETPSAEPFQVETPAQEPVQTIDQAIAQAIAQAPVQQPAQQPDLLNQAILTTLFDLAGIREDIRQLRNAIEDIKFEIENAKGRQQDLFQNLERRMISIEQNQQVLNPQSAVVLSDDIVDPVSQQNQQGTTEIPAAGIALTTINGAITNGAVTNNNQVNLVVGEGADNTLSSENAANPIAIATENTLPEAETPTINLPAQQAARQDYNQAFELLKQSRYEDAIIEFQQMADTWPDSRLAADAYYWMSEARYVNREFERALNGFKTVVSKYPDSQRVPEALLKVGYIQYDIGAYEKAADTFRDILVRFPGHQVTISAQTRLRRIEQTIQ